MSRKKSAALVFAFVMVFSGCTAVMGPHEGNSVGAQSIEFTNSTPDIMLDEGTSASAPVHNFPGVYISDYNNDGRPDVLSLTGHGLTVYENTADGFRHADVLPDLGLEVWGAVFLDSNGDGWDDLLILPREDNPVLLTNREGRFETAQVIEPSLEVPVGAAVNDFDGDGDADVFVIQYGDWTSHPPSGYLSDLPTDAPDNGLPNHLYENTETGLVLANASGITGQHWSLATSFVDLTGDDRPDIHVANDFYNDVLYINQGTDEFSRRIMDNSTNRNAMSSEIGDVNDDRKLDIFVTNIYLPYSRSNLSPSQYMYVKQFQKFLLEGNRIKGNNLLVNQGNGTFVDEAEKYGVRKGGWGWAAVLEDFDGDMDDDLFHTTQITVRNTPFPYATPMIWERTHGGFERLNASQTGFGTHSGWGAATFDYDLDGDMDLIVATKSGPVLYENTATTGNSVEILVTTNDTRSPVFGAEITVSVDDTAQFSVQTSNTDFQSQDSRFRYFGLGQHTTVDQIEVVWPDGTRRQFHGVDANQRMIITKNGIVRMRQLA